MTHIRMTRDSEGSPDGIRVLLYKAGELFQVGTGLMSHALAQAFVQELHVAEEVLGTTPGPSELKTAASVEPPVPSGQAVSDDSGAGAETKTAGTKNGKAGA